MSTDLLRIFKTCFYCHHKSNRTDNGTEEQLLRVEDPGFTQTDFYYYHERCLRVVMNNPENNAKYLHAAIMIVNQINSDRERERQKQISLQVAINRARSLNSTLRGTLSDRTDELNKLLEQTNNALKQKLEIKNEQKQEHAKINKKFIKVFQNE